MAKIERRICDRCDKEYKPERGIIGLSYGKYVTIRSEDIIYTESVYDLCPECAEKFEEFLSFKDEE